MYNDETGTYEEVKWDDLSEKQEYMNYKTKEKIPRQLSKNTQELKGS